MGLLAVDAQVVGVLAFDVVVGVGDGFELHRVEVAHLDGVPGGGEGLYRLPGKCAVERLRLGMGMHDEDAHGHFAVLRASRTTPAWSRVSKYTKPDPSGR